MTTRGKHHARMSANEGAAEAARVLMFILLAFLGAKAAVKREP